MGAGGTNLPGGVVKKKRGRNSLEGQQKKKTDQVTWISHPNIEY